MYGKRSDAFALLMLIIFVFKNLGEIFKFLLIAFVGGFFVFGGFEWLANFVPLWIWIFLLLFFIFRTISKATK